tara:strand:- start:174 stop:299 length:126 start_codon:yes stop_codon:yes gene_type:complete
MPDLLKSDDGRRRAASLIGGVDASAKPGSSTGGRVERQNGR